MEKAIITPYIQQRPSTKRPYSSLRTALALRLFTRTLDAKSSFAKVPINAPQIIRKCSTLNVIPGPPSDFGSRKKSDRYVPGTNPTLIKNATIWTGNVQGLEIILGDLLLDKGMIQAVGEIPGHLLNTYHHLSVIDANGSWLSPGLVRNSRLLDLLANDRIAEL
ncbi:hypothetical protein HHX47_DHR5001074 [Lentinula edodes]|nr:hypothetical protein HHX47_DHR5001074 [Lentinula edodes]